MPQAVQPKDPTATRHVATLSSEADIISFACKGRVIRFKGPYSLARIHSVVTWDHGYLVVMAAYTHSKELVEDYIDLTPILENLYINAEDFLQDVEEVEVKYA